MVRTIYWVLFTLATLVVAALYIPLFWLLRLLDKEQLKDELAWKFGHWWGRVLLAATGSKVKIRGTEHIPQGTVVVMGNHQSYFDIFLVLGYIKKPLGFIAKKEVARLPLIKQWMEYTGCLFLDRENIRQAAIIVQQAIKQAKNGWSMIIFPEGTRSNSATMNTFKSGSMKIPMRAEVPILPVAIQGTYKVFEGNNNRVGSASISLTFCPPIFPQQYQDMNSGQLAQLVEQRVKQGLVDSSV